MGRGSFFMMKKMEMYPATVEAYYALLYSGYYTKDDKRLRQQKSLY